MKSIIQLLKSYLFTLLIKYNYIKVDNSMKSSKLNMNTNQCKHKCYKRKYKYFYKKMKKQIKRLHKINHTNHIHHINELHQLKSQLHENEKMINNVSSILISYISNNI